MPSLNSCLVVFFGSTLDDDVQAPSLGALGVETGTLRIRTHTRRRSYAFTLGSCRKWDLSSLRGAPPSQTRPARQREESHWE
jgi:hypothetical protein